jgi:hypothetical protein
MNYPRYGLRPSRSPFAPARWRLYDMAGVPIFVTGRDMGSFETPDEALEWLRLALVAGVLSPPRPFAGHVGTWVKGPVFDGRNRLFEGDFALSGQANVEEGDMLLLSNDVPQDAGDRSSIAGPQQSDYRPCLPHRDYAPPRAAIPRAPHEQGESLPGVQPEEGEPAPDKLALYRSI